MPRYRVRTVNTASKAVAVQVVCYSKHSTKIIKHIGSTKNDEELELLKIKAEEYISEHEPQTSLFQKPSSNIVAFDQIQTTKVSHQFARNVLLEIARHCELATLDALYLDLAIMRIIEPCSKKRSIELLERYFDISYTRYVYECLPKLLNCRETVETAAIQTAKRFNKSFALLLYDVTTLYFETHKPNDDLQARGFSKDDKSKQPQIVIGLLVTEQGFPLIHEVFKGNTFEGHTMLSVIDKFSNKYNTEKPIIVADAAMLSQTNRFLLEEKGYRYIVGARLANAKTSFIDDLYANLPKHDDATIRLPYTDSSYDVVCSYSKVRYKKNKRDFDNQVKKAEDLISRQESGRRAKFVKKSDAADKPYIFDEDLRKKTEKLLGIKGYCTNIPEDVLSNKQVIEYYHNLWHVEQAFRISKSDLKARPIFHHSHDAIKAHIIICFIALMIGKYIEIKAGYSLRHIRDELWQVHEVHLYDPLSGKTRVARTPITAKLKKILKSLDVTH